MKKKKDIDEELEIEYEETDDVEDKTAEAAEAEYDEDEEDEEELEIPPNKKGKVAIIITLILGWIGLIALIVVFYFYFLEDLGVFSKDKDKKQTTEEITETYEVNANEEINALIQEYFFALETCNQAKLMALVIDFSAFNDMSKYERVASVMSNYNNFNVYTLPGYYGSDTLVYVTCNFDIAGVDTPGLNINQFYLVKTTDGYKIDNTMPDETITAYISEQNGRSDIQELYKSVYQYIEDSAANDSNFKKFAEEYGILQ